MVHILAIEQDRTVGNRIESGEKVAQGGLARTGPSHNAYELTRTDLQVKVTKHGLGLIRVSEGKVTELNTTVQKRCRRRGNVIQETWPLVKQTLNPSERRHAPLKQVRHPTYGHHRPGHEQKIVDKGNEITRRERPPDGHAAAKNEDQQQAGIGE